MFDSRIATAARNAAISACVGMAVVFAASGCGGMVPPTAATTPEATSATASPAASDGIYGNPKAAGKYWQQQSLEDNCGLMSVADVVGEITGKEPNEHEIIKLAEATPSGTNPGPIYDHKHSGGGGIEMADEVVLLDHYGIKSVMTYTAHPEETGLPALERYLGSDRKIIAWVNSAVIWNTNDQRTKADHFLVVTGIDTNKEIVHLNDPGADYADEQVSITRFMTAWKAGEESIVVTAPPS